ncbi:hypothetical protein [Alkalispirochaeta americana]|uniref:hypothetical protein n=1 Tax=Alkalispirochaeta americana TaxID=159291 RepID=UPI00097107E4|nr:hypothetical protein [Alkalispirochaeta americana]
MKRDDFIWTIGYQDGTALVDGPARKKYRNRSAGELLEAGQYRAAFCAALYDGEMDDFLPRFQASAEIPVDSEEALQRLFGVFHPPRGGRSVSVIG